MKRLIREFEEQVRAEAAADGNVRIGEVVISALDILQRDPDAYNTEYERWLNTEWLPARQERLALILATAPHNQERFNDLCDALRRKQVVPFVGAGMSRASGLPGWGALLGSLLKDSSCDKAEFKRLLKQGAYEAAADLLRAGMPLALFNEQLNHLCRVEPAAIVGPVKILPSLFPQLVLTTNFDRVLEIVYAEEGPRMEPVLYGDTLAVYRQERDPTLTTLLKIHGDYTTELGRVFTTEEYNAAYTGTSPLLRELRLSAATNSLLFLGAGLGPDRTVELLRLAAADDAHQPRHYTFQSKPPTEKKRREREHFLVERGIYPIWFSVPARPTTADFDDNIEALLVGMLSFAGKL